MPAKKKILRERKKASSEAEAMGKAFGKATKTARTKAFAVRKTILVERDGWIVRVNKAGKTIQRIKKLKPIVLPAA